MSDFPKVRTVLGRAAGVALALGVVLLRSAATQTPTTFYACYVPSVGAMYMIKLAGLPSGCLSTSHVQIDWTEGGIVADGSITTQKLANGSVTTVKLDNAAVTAAKLAANSVGSTQVLDNSLTGADLVAGTIAEAQLANRAVTTAKLAVPLTMNAVTLLDASGVGTTPRNLGSVSITTAGSGRVIVMLAGDANFFSENTVLNVGLGTTAGGTYLHEVSVGRPDGSGTLRYIHAFASLGVSPITAAGTYSFFATTFEPTVFSATTVNVGSLRLVAVFIPN